jgi:ATP/maltotriose-dependent transcriptional regulator MalT
VADGGARGDQREQAVVLSPATARTHVGRLFAKLGARHRPQLVVLAYETVLVRPGWTTWH